MRVMQKFKGKVRLTVAAFCFAALVTLLLFALNKYVSVEKMRNSLQYRTDLYGQQIRETLQLQMQKANIAAGMAQVSPQDSSWFSEAGLWLNGDLGHGVVCLNLIHGQDVYSYPAPLAKGVQDDVYFQNEFQRTYRAALKRRELVQSAPFRLSDGSQMMLGMVPVMLYNRRNNDFDIWGVSCVTIRLPEVFKEIPFAKLTADGYVYILRDKDGEIVDKTGDELSSPVVTEIDVTGGSWQLAVAPANGWVQWHLWLLEYLESLGPAIFFALVVYGYMALKEQRTFFRHLAYTDYLTKLYNRSFLYRRLDRLCQDEDEHFLLCYLDLNGFKKINDTYGHAMGDLLICRTGERILACLHDLDEVYRMGGDEFVILLRHGGLQEWQNRLEKIESMTAEPVEVNQDVFVRASASIGMALYPQNSRDPDELLKQAERRMAEAKRRYDM